MGNYTTSYSNLGYAWLSGLQMLMGNYTPQEDVGQSFWTDVFYWTYILVAFFLLLNALLAIIVEAYDKVKQGIHEGEVDVLRIMLNDMKGEFRADCLHISSTAMSAFVKCAEQAPHTNVSHVDAKAQAEMAKVVKYMTEHHDKARYTTSTIFYVMPGGRIEQPEPMVRWSSTSSSARASRRLVSLLVTSYKCN